MGGAGVTAAPAVPDEILGGWLGAGVGGGSRVG